MFWILDSRAGFGNVMRGTMCGLPNKRFMSSGWLQGSRVKLIGRISGIKFHIGERDSTDCADGRTDI